MMKKQPALSAAHCQVLQQPFCQFAQMKQFAPESIEGVKAQYRSAWTDWRDFVLAVQAALAAQGIVFAAPHIERWCNGWQVRAHFFAFFKLPGFERDAPILSLILNRQRFTVSLDWHAYKAAQSHISLVQYHQWIYGAAKTANTPNTKPLPHGSLHLPNGANCRIFTASAVICRATNWRNTTLWHGRWRA